MKKTIAVILCFALFCSVSGAGAMAAKSTVADLLNTERLVPLQTGCTWLDDAVKEVIGANTTDKMSTYEKVLALYDYCAKSFTYEVPVMFLDEELYASNLSAYDAMIIENARYLLGTGTGVCDNFAALFMVLTRAIGLQSYYVGGQVKNGNAYSGHAWTVIRLNNAYYIFDTQVENKYYKKDGKLRYSWFGNAVTASPGYQSPNFNEYIAAFGDFKQVYVAVDFTDCDPEIPLFPGEPIEYHVESVDANIEVGDFYYVCLPGKLDTGALQYLSDEEITQHSGRDFTYLPDHSGEWTLFVLLDTERGALINYNTLRVLGEGEYTLARGDINVDGKITAADARLALRGAVKLIPVSEGDPLFPVFDATGDGKVSAEDARLILRAAVRLDVIPPMPSENGI